MVLYRIPNSDELLIPLDATVYIINQICNILIDYSNNYEEKNRLSNLVSNACNINNFIIKDLDIEITHSNIDPDVINTDANHKFITDTELTIFKEKPSLQDMQEALEDLRNDINKEMQRYFINLLNNPNALQTLKNISLLLSEDDNLNSLMNAMKNKVSDEKFNNHTTSHSHLTNNDRKALNLLLSFIKTGCADWNASPEDPNYIRNKPNSLPANGGNADTVHNHNINELLNKQTYDIIYSSCNDNKADKQILDGEEINLSYISTAFKSGTYNLNSLILNESHVDGFKNSMINGCDNILIYDSTINNITIADSKVKVFSGCTLQNITFINCSIELASDMVYTSIDKCTFDRCDIKYNGSILYSFITHNKCIACTPRNALQFFAPDSIISDNLFL